MGTSKAAPREESWDGIGKFDTTSTTLQWRQRREPWWRQLVTGSVLLTVVGGLYKWHSDRVDKAHQDAAAAESQDVLSKEADQRAREFADSERDRIVVSLAPLVLGATGDAKNCAVVNAVWSSLSTISQTEMPADIAKICMPSQVSEPLSPDAPLPTPFSVQISSDSKIEQACFEAKKASEAGFSPVTVWRASEKRYVTCVGSGATFADASGQAAAVRTKFAGRSVVVVNLSARQKKNQWTLADCR